MILVPVYTAAHFFYLESVSFSTKSNIVVAILFEGNACENVQKRLHARFSIEFIELASVTASFEQTSISVKAVDIINRISFKQGSFLAAKFSALANMFSLHIHQVIYQLTLLEVLLQDKPINKVIVFGTSSKHFNFPERADVKTLYHPELTLPPLITHYLSRKSMPFEVIAVESGMKIRLRHCLRRMLLNGYKFAVTLKRKLHTFGDNVKLVVNSDQDSNVAIVIRSQSEYWTVKPLLQALRNEGLNPVIIQDDLIKNPSGKKTLDGDNAQYIAIHRGIGVFSLLVCWIQHSLYFMFSKGRVATQAVVLPGDDDITATLLNEKFYPSWIASTLHALPELAVFEKELNNLHRQFQFKYFITMDMVDQWAGVIGELGTEYGIKSLIIQNTVLDDIVYPKPISTDYMAVSGSHIVNLIKKSDCDDTAILNLGLPIHDEMHQRYQKHSGYLDNGCHIVLATQPFVHEFDFNYHLINDLLDILKQVEMSVKLTIKPHPREDVGVYLALVKTLEYSQNVVVEVNQSDNILLMAEDCDIFLSRTSTALQSFVLLGRVCVSYLNGYPAEICDRLDYLRGDACLKNYSKEQFSDCINEVLTDFHASFELFTASRQQYIDQYVGDFDGQSASRLSRFIVQ